MSAETNPISVWAEGALGRALNGASQSLSNFGIAVPRPLNLFTFFKSLDGVQPILRRVGAFDEGDGINRHVEYLAVKACCEPAVILGGQPFAAERQIILETVANIAADLHAAWENQRELPPEGMPADVFALILAAEAKLEGRCSREKALFMAGTVLQERPKICVEIGVFGGRSMISCAAALRHNGDGVIYGIETWSPDVATDNPLDDKNDQWRTGAEFPRIKREFYRFLAAADLTQQVRVIEAMSARAALLFDQIDFLHIDGARSVVNAAEDVILYARKVRRDGIVVFNDSKLETTAPAFEILRALCDPLTTLTDPVSGKESCVVLRRR